MARLGTMLAGAIFLIWLPYVSAEAQRLVRLDGTAESNAEAPRVLRGSAIAPKPAPKREPGALPVEIGAGEHL